MIDDLFVIWLSIAPELDQNETPSFIIYILGDINGTKYPRGTPTLAIID